MQVPLHTCVYVCVCVCVCIYIYIDQVCHALKKTVFCTSLLPENRWKGLRKSQLFCNWQYVNFVCGTDYSSIGFFHSFLKTCTCVCIHIYIYIYTYTHICAGGPQRAATCAICPPTQGQFIVFLHVWLYACMAEQHICNNIRYDTLL